MRLGKLAGEKSAALNAFVIFTLMMSAFPRSALAFVLRPAARQPFRSNARTLDRTLRLQWITSLNPPAFATCRWMATTNNRNFNNNNNNKIKKDDGSKSEWKVPKDLYIPEDQLDMSFVRSSGAGGQNVNKVNSQVQLKLKLDDSCYWIPPEVRERLASKHANRVNSQRELVLHVQQHRTQTQNRQAALKKLRDFILDAWPRPKVRHMRKGLSRKTKNQRRDDKRKRALVKESRRRVDF